MTGSRTWILRIPLVSPRRVGEKGVTFFHSLRLNNVTNKIARYGNPQLRDETGLRETQINLHRCGVK